MPTVTKVEVTVKADHLMEYVLRELQKTLPTLVPRSQLKVFRVLHYASLESTFSIPYYPCRPQPQVGLFDKHFSTIISSL